MNEKIMFTIRIHSLVDVITNSSTELFVTKSSSKSEVEELIKSVYPDYRSEYDELKSMDELTSDELDAYMSYVCSPCCWPSCKSSFKVLPGFTFDELYEPDGRSPARNGEIQYQLKCNDDYRFVTDENFEWVKNRLDPKREMYFMFSIDENPDWDMQENLMNFMERIHLG